MEEGSRDTPEERPARSSVRRRLFVDDESDNENNDVMYRNQLGRLDNETNTFIEETRRVMGNARERWNFDFENEEPLPGRYEWVKVNENFSDDVPNGDSPTDKNIPYDKSKESKTDDTESTKED